MVIFMPMHACIREEGESVSKWHFLVVVPWPIGFCILKKQANHSVITSLPDETLLGKLQLPFFSSLAVVMRKWTADKNGALGQQCKDSKTCTTDFREEYQTNIYVLWNFHLWYAIIWRCNVFWVLFSVVHVGMYGMVDACSVHLFVIRTCALCLKSY